MLVLTKTGINMDAVRDMGIIVKKRQNTRIMMLLAVLSSLFSVIPVEDNPFMAGAFFRALLKGDSAISVGVSGPGVVKHRT